MGKWIERQKNMIDFTLSSLFRRKGKNTALILAYTLVVFMLASVAFFTHAIKEEALRILPGAPEMVVQRQVAGRHEPIPASYISAIKEIRGVRSAKGRLWGYYYDPVAGANYTVIASGNGVPNEGKITIGQGISRTRLVFQGDTMEFRGYDGKLISLEIGSIFSPGSELVSSDVVLISKGDFSRLFGISNGYATDLVLKVANQKELSAVAGRIAERLPDARIIPREEILTIYRTVFSWQGGIMVAVLLGALLAFIIFAWDKASGLSLEERREIGVLKAIGWETSDVLLLKCWEGAVIPVLSFMVGILLAYVHVFWASSALFQPVLKGWAVLYPRFSPVPFIDAGQVAVLFLLTVVPYTVAAVIPSWKAATVDPDLAMR